MPKKLTPTERIQSWTVTPIKPGQSIGYWVDPDEQIEQVQTDVMLARLTGDLEQVEGALMKAFETIHRRNSVPNKVKTVEPFPELALPYLKRDIDKISRSRDLPIKAKSSDPSKPGVFDWLRVHMQLAVTAAASAHSRNYDYYLKCLKPGASFDKSNRKLIESLLLTADPDLLHPWAELPAMAKLLP